MKTQHPVRGEVGRIKWFFWGVQQAGHNMAYPWRATLLIFVLGPALHVQLTYVFLVYIGYLVCAVLDQMQKDNVLNEEISWQSDPGDPESESLGELSRVKLPRDYQIAVYRVAELLDRMV
jgi:hypothetical protein